MNSAERIRWVLFALGAAAFVLAMAWSIGAGSRANPIDDDIWTPQTAGDPVEVEAP